MANTVPLSSVTMPTPQPYDSQDVNRQRENFFYIVNQILMLGKTAGWEIPGPLDFWQAIEDLQYEGVLLDLGHIKVIKTGKTGSVINT